MSYFPADIVEAAQRSYAKYFPKGPYASVTIAQWAVESAYGKAEPQDSNNPFGIKAIAGQPYVTSLTREVLRGQTIEIPQKFAKYPSVEEAFEAHAKLLATAPIYKEAQQATTVEGYVRAMAKHYATAPNYADVILGLIHKANLTQYDLPVTAPPAPIKPAPPVVSTGAPLTKPKVNSMGGFLSIMMTLLGDVPEALQLIQTISSNPIAKDIESLFANHTTVTTTPGQAMIIEPNNSVPKTGVSASVTSAVPAPSAPVKG
jgi:hypothetical protein